MASCKGPLCGTFSREAVADILRSLIPLLPFDEVWDRRCNPDIAAAECWVIDTGHPHLIDCGFFEGSTPAPPTPARPADRVPA